MPCISSPIVFVVMTGFSGAPRACTHWAASNEKDCSMLACFGHRLIAIIEFFPVLGGIVALVDLLFSKIICSVSDTKVARQSVKEKSLDDAGFTERSISTCDRNSLKNKDLNQSQVPSTASNADVVPKGEAEQLRDGMNAVKNGQIKVVENSSGVTIVGEMDLGSSSDEW